MGRRRRISAGRQRRRHCGRLRLRYSACFCIRNGIEALQRQPAMRHAIAAQALQLRQAQLQGVVAKDIGHRLVKALLLPFQEIVPEG